MNDIRTIKNNKLSQKQIKELKGARVLDPDYFDSAIVGVEDGCAVYDYYTIIDLLQQEDGMDMEEAMEHCSFNIEGSLGMKRSPKIKYTDNKEIK